MEKCELHVPSDSDSSTIDELAVSGKRIGVLRIRERWLYIKTRLRCERIYTFPVLRGGTPSKILTSWSHPFPAFPLDKADGLLHFLHRKKGLKFN